MTTIPAQVSYEHVEDYAFYKAMVFLIVNRIWAAATIDHLGGEKEMDWRTWWLATKNCKRQRPHVYAEAERTAFILVRQEVDDQPMEPEFTEMERVYWLGQLAKCRECHEEPAIVDGLCFDCYAEIRRFARP